MEYTFGVSGKLYRNGNIIYDHQTKSLWSHVTGDAVTGEMRGTKLDLVPVMHLEWGVWKELHPDTLVMVGPYGRYPNDPAEDYYVSPNAGILGETISDRRLLPKELIIGLKINDKTKAYPFSILSRRNVVNDTFQDVPIVIAFDSERVSGVVLDRLLGERALTFAKADGSSDKGPIIIDKETGSRWLAFSGEAISGKLKGEFLKQIETTYAFWFGWKDHYPDTEVFK